MNNVMSTALSKLYKFLPWMQSDKKAVDTLTAFVRDAEHDLFAVLTALQAHLDLFQDEEQRSHNPVIRFAVLNRAVARIGADIGALAAIAELVVAPPSKRKQMLEGLMQEIAQETQPAFNSNRVSLSFSIAKDASVGGDASALKVMIAGMVLAVLHQSREFETVRLIGLAHKDSVSLSCDTGSPAGIAVFKSWQLGELRLSPTNGQGLNLAAVAAMAQLHHGQLSVSTRLNQRPGYRLTFNV